MRDDRPDRRHGARRGVIYRMTSLEFHLRINVVRRLVRLARRCADVAVWLGPWLGGRSL